LPLLKAVPLAFGLLCLLPRLADAAPSFDCSKASHDIEKLVCANAELARLGKRLTERFAKAHENLSSEQKHSLDAEQRGWIKHADAPHPIGACR